jgi:hypothetical protein
MSSASSTDPKYPIAMELVLCVPDAIGPRRRTRDRCARLENRAIWLVRGSLAADSNANLRIRSS